MSFLIDLFTLLLVLVTDVTVLYLFEPAASISRALSIRSFEASLFQPKIFDKPFTTVHLYFCFRDDDSSSSVVSITSFGSTGSTVSGSPTHRLVCGL